MPDTIPISVGEQIKCGMVTALNAPGDKPATTYRSRVDAVASTEMPALVLYGVDEEVDGVSYNRKLRKLKVRVEMMQAGEAPADSLTDSLYVFVVNTLMQSGNGTFADLIKELAEKKLAWNTEAGERDTTLALVEFEATYLTEADPTKAVLMQ